MPQYRSFLSIAALVVITLSMPAQDSHSTAAKNPSTPVVITDQDNGKDIDLPHGGTLLVRLKSNPSTGYSWAVKGDPSPLKLEKATVKKGKQSGHVAGAPGTQELRFTSSSSGIATLTLEYRRPWEYNVTPAKTFSAKVNVR